MSFVRYLTYRPSGTEWLGAVPSHWNILPLKRFAQFVYGEALSSEQRLHDGDIGVYGSNGRVGTHAEANTNAPVLLIGRKGSCGALNWSNAPVFAIDTVYFVDAHTCKAHLRWLYWALHVADLAAASQDTGVPGLSREFAHSLPFGVPPLLEQIGIAAFLDRETAKIDALVDKQRRLIELLKEKRQAVISHAVTKGLDPNAPMKDSGIEWLGKVPAHWTKSPLKDLASVRGRIGYRGYTTDDLVDDGQGALALGGANLSTSGRVDLTNRTFLSWSKYEESPEIMVEVGDLLLGQRGTCGKPVVVDRNIGPATINPSLVVLKPLTVDSFFLCYFLMGSFISNVFDSYLSSTAVPMLSQLQIGGIPVVFPPPGEQTAITNFLNSEANRVDRLIGDAESAMLLLQERRSAIISAAVTGKIDLRGFTSAASEAA